VRGTPGLGQPRRVPLGSDTGEAAAGGRGTGWQRWWRRRRRRQLCAAATPPLTPPQCSPLPGLNSARPGGGGPAALGNKITPAPFTGSALDREFVTPLACLFDRFDALAIDTGTSKRAPATAAGRPTSAATGGGAGPAPGAGAAGGSRPPALPPPAITPLAVPRPSAPAPGSVPRSPLGPARRVPMAPPATAARPSRHGPGAARVSFGTPVVHTYGRVAASGDAPCASGSSDDEAEAEETPLPSTAGHTPYSLPGSRGHSAVGAGVAGVSPIGMPVFGSPAAEDEDKGEDADAEAGEDCHYSPGEVVVAGADGGGGEPAGFEFFRGAGASSSGAAATPARAAGAGQRTPGGGGAVTPTLFGAVRVPAPAPAPSAAPPVCSTPAPATAAAAAASAAHEDVLGALPFARESPGGGVALEEASHGAEEGRCGCGQPARAGRLPA
jgi:hypothetical protein